MYTQMTTVCLWGSVNQGIIHVHCVSIDCTMHKNGEMTLPKDSHTQYYYYCFAY